MWISINKQESVAYPELYLLIHFGGLIFYADAWDTSKEFVTFDTSAFPSGINHIVLLTKDLQVISERLFFLLNEEHGTAVFQTQKEIFRKREQVQSEIRLKDGGQLPLKGNFSIAVTNDREVIADTASGILSGMLLRSELKGFIDHPEYYFQKGNRDAEFAADLLMKTHGWTRYATPDVIRGKLSYPAIPFEAGPEISGTVKSGLLAKAANQFDVLLVVLNPGFYNATETDENGRYVFRNPEFPDSTQYIIQTLNSKGKKQMAELFVDEETFPGIHTARIEALATKENPVLLDYVAKADLHYTYENGMRVINLPEVEVRGTYKDKDKYKYKSSFYSTPDYSFSAEDIEKYSGTNIGNLLYRVPGVRIMGNDIRIRMSDRAPLILLDGMPIMVPGDDDGIGMSASGGALFSSGGGMSVMDVLRTIPVSDVGQIDVLKDISNTVLYGFMGSGGVIAIYTKRGEGRLPLPSYNIKTLTPLGYQLPVEFYSPKYDSQERLEDTKPDLRTTIYWNPNVLTDDEGKVKLDFYTADDPATYSVIIEGVSDEGKLIHFRGDGLIRME